MANLQEAFEKKGFHKKENSVHSKHFNKDSLPRILEFYIDNEKKKLNKDWMEKECEKWGEKFHFDRVKSSQIRKFYGDVLAMDSKAETQEFEIILPQIKMLKSKTAYASSPNKSGRIPESFKDFLNKMVDRVNDKKDLKAFKLIFEAILGFYYGKGGIQ